MSFYSGSYYRPPSRGPLGSRSVSAPGPSERVSLSRSGSSNTVYSRAGSIAPTTAPYVNNFSSASNYEFHSRSPTPTMTNYEYQWSRSPSCSESRSGSRSRSPIPSYSDALCKASRQLRERSIPPPPPPPEPPRIYNIPPQKKRSLSGRPPLPPAQSQARVVASDFYRGKVKSIYEREPLFHDFAKNLRLEENHISLYNASSLDNIKKDFYSMVEDKWKRKTFSDPSVEHDFGRKLYPWQNVVGREAEPASLRIAKIQASRPRLATPPPLPAIRLYHRSTIAK